MRVEFLLTLSIGNNRGLWRLWSSILVHISGLILFYQCQQNNVPWHWLWKFLSNGRNILNLFQCLILNDWNWESEANNTCFRNTSCNLVFFVSYTFHHLLKPTSVIWVNDFVCVFSIYTYQRQATSLSFQNSENLSHRRIYNTHFLNKQENEWQHCFITILFIFAWRKVIFAAWLHKLMTEQSNKPTEGVLWEAGRVPWGAAHT